MTSIRIPVPHVDSVTAYDDVACSYGRHEVTARTAVTIASWWQSSGTIGRHLASLASGAPVTVSDVLDDIARSRASAAKGDCLTANDARALDMLATFVLNAEADGWSVDA